MSKLPRVALILLSAEWFNSVVALPALVEALKQDRQAIVGAFNAQLDIAAMHLVESTDSLQTACRALKAADVDLVILSFQAWAEDFYLIPLLGDRTHACSRVVLPALVAPAQAGRVRRLAARLGHGRHL